MSLNDELAAYLRDPTQLPDEFKSWVTEWIQINPPSILMSDVIPGSDPWHAMTGNFLNGALDWDASLASHQPAYRLTEGSRVFCRGLVKAGGGGLAAFTPFFTLPLGYRPGGEMLFGSASNDAFCSWGISPNGNMYPRLALGAAAWLSIAVSFYAAPTAAE